MHDRIVLVTGGASGIGAACVRRLVALGARPVVADRALGDVDLAGDPASLRLDVRDVEEVDRAVAAIEARLGPIDGLINAAGIQQKTAPPSDMAMDEWDRILAVDLRGSYALCRAVGPLMARRGRGAIVNVASIAGMTSGPLHAYGPAKAGIINLTTTLAGEWGRAGVRVNCVSPGFTTTPGLQKGIDKGVVDATRLAASSALGRMIEADEVAAAILWLLGDDASAVTGINLPVDAGFLSATTWAAYGGVRGE